MICGLSPDSAAKADTGIIVTSIITDRRKLSTRFNVFCIISFLSNKNSRPFYRAAQKKEPVKAPLR